MIGCRKFQLTGYRRAEQCFHNLLCRFHRRLYDFCVPPRLLKGGTSLVLVFPLQFEEFLHPKQFPHKQKMNESENTQRWLCEFIVLKWRKKKLLHLPNCFSMTLMVCPDNDFLIFPHGDVVWPQCGASCFLS